MKSEKRKALGLDSKVVYMPPDAGTNAINPPIVMASSFQYDADIYQQVDQDKQSNALVESF